MQSKTKFVFKYDNIEKQGEIQNICAIGYEKKLCRQTVNTLMSEIYINKGQLDLAQKWLDGEMWDNSKKRVEKSIITSMSKINRKFYMSLDMDDIKIIKSKLHDLEIILNSMMQSSFYVSDAKNKIKEIDTILNGEKL